MKGLFVAVMAVVVIAGGVGAYAWTQRLELALARVQANPKGRGPVDELAWSTLEGLADRPELESVVRAQAVGEAEAIAEVEPNGPPVVSRGLFGQVYAAQPERLDEPVIAAAYTFSCAQDCAYGEAGRPPRLNVPYFLEAAENTPQHRAGLREAALRLAALRGERARNAANQSFVALTRAAAESRSASDLELARAIAGRVLATNMAERETKWLRATIQRLVGQDEVAEVWTAALLEETDADPTFWAWEIAIDAVAAGGPPQSPEVIEALVSLCARRSKKVADQACVDLGLMTGPKWEAALQALTAHPEGGRALAAEQARVMNQDGRSVLTRWREAEPSEISKYQRTQDIRVSPMASARERRLNRSERREVALIERAPADEAIDEVETIYRTTKNWAVIRMTTEVLAKRAPDRLSAAVVPLIGSLGPLARAFQGGGDYDRTAYGTAGQRVASALLQLEAHSDADSRMIPLLLALSIPDAKFSTHASKALRRSLTADQFADGLFRFLAQRPRFSVDEVKTYRETLVSYENVGSAIARNLAGLLEAAGGKPEKVSWIHKLIGIPALGRTGDRGHAPLLAQYAQDTATYQATTTYKKTLGSSAKPASSETKRFSELADSARDQLLARAD